MLLFRYSVHTAHPAGSSATWRTTRATVRRTSAQAKRSCSHCIRNAPVIHGWASRVTKDWAMDRSCSWRPTRRWSQSVAGKFFLIWYSLYKYDNSKLFYFFCNLPARAKPSGWTKTFATAKRTAAWLSIIHRYVLRATLRSECSRCTDSSAHKHAADIGLPRIYIYGAFVIYTSLLTKPLWSLLSHTHSHTQKHIEQTNLSETKRII